MDRRSFLLLGAATMVGFRRVSAAEPGWGSLAAQLRGALLLPSSPDYDRARQLFNPRLDRHPGAIAMCADAQDAQTCVQWALNHRKNLSVRAGGHGYEGYCLSGQLVVDVSALHRIEVDPKLISVEAGARLVEAYAALTPRQLALPGGSCPTVGVAGYTLGGGFGLLSRQLGMSCDRLRSADLVTPTGQFITVNADSHADLFWALRGGGNGNFGVVTRLELRPAPLQRVTAFRLEWPWEDFLEVVQAWTDWAPRADRRMGSALSMTGGKKPSVRMTGILAGGEVEPLLPKWPTPRWSYRKTGPLGEAMAWVGGKVGQRSSAFKVHSHMLRKPHPRENWKELQTLLARPTVGFALKIQLDAFGGAIDDLDPSATAFCHRGALACFQALAYWKPQGARAARAALKEMRDLYAPFAADEVYQNYVDADLVNPLEAYYGVNLPRLRQLKARIDPHRVMHTPQFT